MSATAAHRRRKVEAVKPGPSVVSLAPALPPTREALMASIKPPKLSLDDIVIVAKYGKTPNEEPLVLSGAELARVLSLRAAYSNASHMTGDGDVNVRLRGLADLFVPYRHGDGGEISEHAAYFLVSALEDLAARLEADSSVDAFSVFLRENKAVTA